MSRSDDALIISLVEAGSGTAPWQRSLMLFAVARPDLDERALAGSTLGERDVHIARLREGWFGPDMRCVSDCPGCGERLECLLSTRTLFAEREAAPNDLVALDGGQVRLRPIRVGDLADVLGPERPTDAQGALLRLCIVEQTGAPGLEGDAETGLLSRLLALDPFAETLLEFGCPCCGHAWSVPFDIGTYLWAELQVRSQALLDEVHLLASAYHWSEADILALSPRRRRAYLDRVTS